MKKFVFSLGSVLKYRETVEKQQQGELSKANAALLELREKEQELSDSFDRCANSLDNAIKENRNLAKAFEEHGIYFQFLREKKEELMILIEKAEEEKRRCQEALVETMKEIKTLKNLKEEQYKKYLEELRAEEAKDIGDLVSFQTITEEADI